jgi:hypothetical protein
VLNQTTGGEDDSDGDGVLKERDNMTLQDFGSWVHETSTKDEMWYLLDDTIQGVQFIQQ